MHLLRLAGLGSGLGDVSEAAAEAEAAELDPSVLVQKHIGRLQVAVDDPLRVQVLSAQSNESASPDVGKPPIP